MSVLTVDTQNFANSIDAFPDKLRAEIGYVFGLSPNTGQYISRRVSSGKVSSYHTTTVPVNDQSLLPIKKTRVFISGDENSFSNQQEWRQYCQDTIKVNAEYTDHSFMMDSPEITSKLVKEYHRPEYEDLTKQYSTNQLLSYTLMSYPFKEKTEVLRRIADRKTVYDSKDFVVSTREDLERSFSQFATRIENYSASSTEIDTKQRNVFDLYVGPIITEDDLANGFYNQTSFPFHYDIYLPVVGSTQLLSANMKFRRLLRDYGKAKNVFKALKNDSVSFERSFTTGDTNASYKMHNFMEFLTTDRISSFSQGDDELFMLPERDLDENAAENRFVNQLNNIQFFSQTRSFLKEFTRDYNKTAVNPENSHTVFLGYKIQKFMDRNGGNPIQTYYTTKDGLIDTQLKYGRKYNYKVHLLLGIVGTSYSYSNLFISDDNGMSSLSGIVPSTNPDGFNEVSNKKYKAYVDAIAIPSFQIIEMEVFSDTIAFVDAPTLPPQVNFFGRKEEPIIGMIFRPNFFRIESVSSELPDELGRALDVPFRPSDAAIIDLLKNFSKDNTLRGDYFSGIYEIYRMETKPQNYLDFVDNYLATVDVSTTMVNQGREPREQISKPTVPTKGSKTHSNQIAHFEDVLVPHRIYYYLFRAVTYHGTPSNVTITYQVELQRDADEYKLIIKEYTYGREFTPEAQFNFKRLLNLIPNEERMVFTHPSDQQPSIDNFSLDNGAMFAESTRTIKLRVTSKHTGKKIDLNLNFKLNKDGSFDNY